jgi:ferric-dicitrate binding protein FerR (iron transport regulator)
MGRKKNLEELEDLEHTGARFRDLIVRDPRAGDEIRRGRAVFLEEVERRNASSGARRALARGHGRWLPLIVSVSVAAGVAAPWILSRPVTFQIGEARQGDLGSDIEATEGRIVPVSFSEGSTLVLHDGGRIRVLSLKRGDARVLVEDGVVDASIDHHAGRPTKWEFEVGSYQVTVHGTRFRMAFRASHRSLRVSTQEGSVAVSGGCLDAAKTVSAGQSLEASCPVPATPAPAPDEVPVTEPPRAPARELAPMVKARRTERWRELLAAGRLLEGLRAAEGANFDKVCRAATANELLALADAGRFFGPPERAIAALVAMRVRFPGSTAAGTAAFTLGRIVFEKEHDYPRAATWFETYLREQPTGPLMGDAFGRLMQARLRAGDAVRARASAEQYLRRFPRGPYSAEARGILSQ